MPPDSFESGLLFWWRYGARTGRLPSSVLALSVIAPQCHLPQSGRLWQAGIGPAGRGKFLNTGIGRAPLFRAAAVNRVRETLCLPANRCIHSYERSWYAHTQENCQGLLYKGYDFNGKRGIIGSTNRLAGEPVYEKRNPKIRLILCCFSSVLYGFNYEPCRRK